MKNNRLVNEVHIMDKYLKQFSVDLGQNLLDVYYTNCNYDNLTSKYLYRIGDIEVASSEFLIKDDDLIVRKLSFAALFWRSVHDFDDLIARIVILILIPLFGIPLYVLLIDFVNTFIKEASF